MNVAASLCLLSLSVSLPALPHEINLPHMRPEAAVRMQSYGEPSTALIDLIVPFLAQRHFRPDRPRSVSGGGIALAVFSSDLDPNNPAVSDAVVAEGTFNSLSVTYCSWVSRYMPHDPKGPGRASTFLVELKDFLSTLPTPRIEVTAIKLDSKHACGTAF